MRVSYKWLGEYVKLSLSPHQVAQKLTMAGLEVEEIAGTLPEFSGILVARVLSVNKHPNADRLSICHVQAGKGPVQVICGAPNVAAGQMVPFAPVGITLPTGVQINQACIRGVESYGMICSEAELAVSDRADGIWVLPDSFQVGGDLHKILESRQDHILEINITPNRPDAMSMIGIAREVAALTSIRYRYPKFRIQEKKTKSASEVKIQVRSKGCPRYTARIIRNIKVGPSPQWLANRLEAAGIRPINNIVDITNFVLIESGQPLHAFDLETLAGKKIVVRDSKPGEKFVTLDGKERELPPRTVMICDAEKPVAVGGIMGGLNSEVSDTTVNVLLESAYFNPVSIGIASRQLGLNSEASQRFERGVDPEGVLWASNRAAALMVDLAGGEVLKGIVEVYPVKIKPKQVPLRVSRVNLVLGTHLNARMVTRVLSKLEIKMVGQNARIPTFRPDLEREIDLIEEIARIYDFGKIPTKTRSVVEYDTLPNKEDHYYSFLKSQIRELGFSEVITNSMMARRDLEAVGDSEPVVVRNPISDDMNVMRPSLLPGLLKTALYNVNRHMPDIRIYELGRVFRSARVEDPASQPYFLAALINGQSILPRWDRQSLPVDFYDIKGFAESFLSKIFLDNVDLFLYDKHVYFDPEQSLSVMKNNEILGYFGRIKTEVGKWFGIEGPVYGIEFDVQKLYPQSELERRYRAFSKFPYTEKDLALIVDKKVPAAEVKKLIAETGGDLLTFIEVFDVYEDERMETGKQSLAFRLRFQSGNRTLTDSEVNVLFSRIIRVAEEKLHARLRE